jgi:hypothetical protein
VQEGRRQKAGGSKEYCLYSKLFNLFELVTYFCRAGLVAFLDREMGRYSGSHVDEVQRSGFWEWGIGNRQETSDVPHAIRESL